jgi:hypothetical protein
MQRETAYRDSEGLVLNCPLCGSKNVRVIMDVSCQDCGMMARHRKMGETQREIRNAIIEWNCVSKQDLLEAGIIDEKGNVYNTE